MEKLLYLVFIYFLFLFLVVRIGATSNRSASGYTLLFPFHWFLIISGVPFSLVLISGCSVLVGFFLPNGSPILFLFAILGLNYFLYVRACALFSTSLGKSSWILLLCAIPVFNIIGLFLLGNGEAIKVNPKDEEILAYIFDSIENGYNEKQIKKEVIDAGYTEARFNKLFLVMKKRVFEEGVDSINDKI